MHEYAKKAYSKPRCRFCNRTMDEWVLGLPDDDHSHEICKKAHEAKNSLTNVRKILEGKPMTPKTPDNSDLSIHLSMPTFQTMDKQAYVGRLFSTIPLDSSFRLQEDGTWRVTKHAGKYVNKLFSSSEEMLNYLQLR